MERARLDGMGWLFLVLGVGSLANALWMLAGPMQWDTDVPAAAPDTGPFNSHFVRDIGCAFLAAGVALVWAVVSERFRLPLAASAALFLVSHALLHIFDTVRGALGHAHWWLDFPGVYLPALLVGGAVWSLARRDSGARA